jgi:hypothetical protein
MKWLQKLVLLGIFDAIIGFAFVFSNMWVWQRLNGQLTVNTWGPLEMGIIPKSIVGGEAVTFGLFVLGPNYPFILFWVALAVNFIFVALALKNQKQ